MLAQGIICQNENVHSNHTRGECEKWFFLPLPKRNDQNPMENNITNDEEKEKNLENWIK